MKNAVAICCFNAAAMLDLPLPLRPSTAEIRRIEKAQRGQAGLLRGAADINDEMFAALKAIVAESDIQDEEAEHHIAEVCVARLERALAKCRAAIAKAEVTALW